MKKNVTAERDSRNADALADRADVFRDALEGVARAGGNYPELEGPLRSLLVAAEELMDVSLSSLPTEQEEQPEKRKSRAGRHDSAYVPRGYLDYQGLLVKDTHTLETKQLDARDLGLIRSAMELLQQAQRNRQLRPELLQKLEALFEADGGYQFGKYWQWCLARQLGHELERRNQEKIRLSHPKERPLQVLTDDGTETDLTNQIPALLQKGVLTIDGINTAERGVADEPVTGEVDQGPRAPSEILAKIRCMVREFQALQSLPEAPFVEDVPAELTADVIELALEQTVLGRGGGRKAGKSPEGWVRSFVTSLTKAKNS